MRAVSIVAAGLLTLMGTGLSAQQMEVRSDMVAFRDSIRHFDAPALRRVVGSLEQYNRRAADDPLAALRTGTAALVLAESTGSRPDFVTAVERFERVLELRPDWAVGWSQLGFAELGELETGGMDVMFRRLFGGVPENRVAGRFLKAIEIDSSDLELLRALTEAGLADQGGSREKVALTVIRTVDRSIVMADPATGILLARMEHAVGDRDSALAVIEKVVERFPDHPDANRLLGIYRFTHGVGDGITPWYRGVRLADEQTIQALARDLVPVIADSVFERMHHLSGGERVSLFRDIWASHDPDGLPTADERVREHYRRLMFARRYYTDAPTRAMNRRYQFDTLAITALDDRGRIMLRHGSPVSRTSLGPSNGPHVESMLRVVGMPENETWRYVDPDGNERLYHFVADPKGSTYRSVESIFDIIARSGQFKRFRAGREPLGADSSRVTVQTYGAELVSMVAQQVLISRASSSDLYTRMLNEGKKGADSLQQLEREIGRASLAVPVTYELGYELALDAATQLLVVGSDGSSGVIQLAFAVPSEQLIVEPVNRGFAHRLRFRIAVQDESGRTVAVVDTVRAFVTPQVIPPGRHLLGQIPIKVAPGRYRVRAAVETSARGVLTAAVPLVVPDAGSGRLTITDVALGSRSVPIIWRAPGADTAWVNPIGRFSAREAMQLYFEIGGLPTDAPYRVNLAIDRYSGRRGGCGGDGRQLAISFDQRHGGGIDRIQREVSLDRLDTGRYGIVVEVVAGEQRTSSCREFQITR